MKQTELQYDKEIAVIGGGAAGIMAYLRAVLNCDDTVLFQGDADTKRRGRATWVHEVDNVPGMHDLKKPILATAKSTLNWVKNHPQLSAYSTVVNGKVNRIELLGEHQGFRLFYTEKKTRTQYVCKGCCTGHGHYGYSACDWGDD